MPAATTFTLVVLTVATTLVTITGFRDHADQAGSTIVRWGVLYAVAVVMPWAWGGYLMRVSGDARGATAAISTGSLTLVAALGVMQPRQQADWPLIAVYVALGVAVLLGTALLGKRVR